MANQARVTAPSAKIPGTLSGDTEGPETLGDLPLTPYVEIAESFSILETAAEKSRLPQGSYFFRKAKMAYIAADSNKKAKHSEIRSFFDT